MNRRISKRINAIARLTTNRFDGMKSTGGQLYWPVGSFRDIKKRLKKIYYNEKSLGNELYE